MQAMHTTVPFVKVIAFWHPAILVQNSETNSYPGAQRLHVLSGAIM